MPIETVIAGSAAWLWGRYGEKFITKIESLALEQAKKAGQTVTESAAAKIRATIRKDWKRFQWDEAAAKYCERMRQDYNTMRVLGMSGPVPLENIFTDVFILDKITGSQILSVEELLKLQDERSAATSADRRPALEAVKTSPRLFLLGKPGAGKTTLMKWIVIQCADGKIARTPIFVTLKEWSDSRENDLLSFISRQFEIHGFPDARLFIEALLSEGSALVLFDGLDEVNVERGQRSRIIASVKEFSKTYRHAHCIITCRIAATEYVFEDFSYVELADFTLGQAERFASNWFRTDKERANGFREELYKQDNKDLRDLARTPLLLTLLCLNYQETLRFPHRRVELYDKAIDVLLAKWDASRMIRRDVVYQNLSLGRKWQLLCKVAAEASEKGETMLQKRELAKRIAAFLKTLPGSGIPDETDGQTVLQSIEAQHGLLVTRAEGIASFSHKTFQEYFTAKNIEKWPLPDVFKRLVNRSHNDGWHEVLMMSASLLETEHADQLFKEWMLHKQLLLCGTDALKRFAKWVVSKAASTVEPTNEAAKAQQAVYSALALFLIRARMRSMKETLDPKFESQISLAIQASRTLALELGRKKDLGYDLDHQFPSKTSEFLSAELSHDLERACQLIKMGGTPLDVGMCYFMFALYQTHDAPDAVQRAFRSAFSQALTNVPDHAATLRSSMRKLTPPRSSDQEEWLRFGGSFLGLLQSELNIGYTFDFAKDDMVNLTRYLTSHRRMLQCLEVASVTDRHAIKESLFSMPES